MIITDSDLVNNLVEGRINLAYIARFQVIMEGQGRKSNMNLKQEASKTLMAEPFTYPCFISCLMPSTTTCPGNCATPRGLGPSYN